MSTPKDHESNVHVLILFGLIFFSLLQAVPAIRTGEVVGTLHLSLFYTNLRHEAAEGFCDRSFNDNWCDTYFNICVTSADSSEKCNLYSEVTETHYDKTHVKYIDKDAFQIPLSHPIPERMSIAVTAYDNDRFTSHDLIAIFVNNDVQVPIPKISMNAGLINVQKTAHNQNVNITVHLSTKCLKGFFGDKCSIECLPEKYPSMSGCHDNGTSICLPGFRGQFCEKPDACFYKPCIPGAECINVDDTPTGYKCVCGGIEGLHCYAGYNPCVPSPCKNQGQCVRTGEKQANFFCNCPIQWTGKLCEVQRSPCEVARQKLANADLKDLSGANKEKNQSSTEGTNKTESISVCKNGGVCVDLMEEFKFICNCTRGWKGELCEIPDWTNVIITGCVIAGILLIIICAIVPCCLRMRALRRKKASSPIEPFVYSRGVTKEPAPERIPMDGVFYNSVVFPSPLSAQGANNTQQFYEYCTVPSTGEADLSTFTSNEYELSVEEKAPPELPDRPKGLAPIPRSPNMTAFQEDETVRSPRTESTYSGQPLLTPRASGVLPTHEDLNHDNLYVKTLPKRSVESGESTLSKLLKLTKK
ncbi:hypothetical protein Aperf_G00000035416 [Anoplocephala perfoliata]